MENNTYSSVQSYNSCKTVEINLILNAMDFEIGIPEFFAGKTVFITGGSGFIGKYKLINISVI